MTDQMTDRLYIESDEAVQEMYEFINNVILFDIPAEFKGKGQ